MSRFAALALIALLAGCGPPPGEVYPLALADAQARVAATEVPTFVLGSAAAAASPMTQGDTIFWPITAKGQEVFRYVATLAPVDAAHTRVSVAIVPAPAGAAGAKVAEGLKANADIAELYRKAMVEAVDATMEHRDFALGAIAPAMTLAALGHLDDINATFDREIDRHGKQVKSNLERAYAAEGVEY